MRRFSLILLVAAFCAVAGDIARRPQIYQTADATTLVNPYWYATTHATYISVETPAVQTADGSVAITVPSDANTIAVVASGYRSTNGALIEKLNFTNAATLDFTNVVAQRWDGTNVGIVIALYYIQTDDAGWPGTGAKNLYFGAAGTILTGLRLSVIYLKGIALTGTIVDSASRDVLYSGAWDTAFSGVSANDFSLIAGRSNTTAPNSAPSGVGQTNIVSTSIANNDSQSISYEYGEDVLEIQYNGGLFVPLAAVFKSQ